MTIPDSGPKLLSLKPILYNKESFFRLNVCGMNIQYHF